MSEGTLITTLNRIRNRAPHCAELIDAYISIAQAGWNPEPNTFLETVAQFRASSDSQRLQQRDLMFHFVNICLHTDSEEFNEKIKNASS